MRRQWVRATAASTLYTHEGSFGTLLGGKNGKPPNDWHAKLAPHLSAVAGKQLPQTRVAATAHPDWNICSAYKLCYAAQTSRAKNAE